ncbi:ribonuclease P protein component [Roseibium aestuarii]|uniref:Ribonuclease P protein component n=1 Tax=Roseibium aestuarii TaxID=2600299 RepID=A0ABW4JV84_9HYPH|nr:ribonuclease P protein component [Roseibium aestuarii]
MDTLKKRSEFLAVAKGGRVGRRAFVLQGLQREAETPSRVGYTVTKKTGNSVVRSRIKRRLRAAVRALDPADVPPRADFVLVGREAALSHPFENLVSDLRTGLRQVLDPKASQGGRRPQRQGRGAKPAPGRKQG